MPLRDGRLRARARFALARVLDVSLGVAVLVVAGRLVGGAPDAVIAFAPAEDPKLVDEAIKALEKFNTSFPDSRFTFQVAELLGMILSAAEERLGIFARPQVGAANGNHMQAAQ